MHFTKINILLIGLLITVSLKMNAQIPSSSPLGNSILRYEANPIDLSSGLPNISVPLFNLPTIADGLGINLAINYHPNSVAVNGIEIGNCGRGWTMFTGGGIYGTNAYERLAWVNGNGSNSYFDYNFMGYSGTFYVEKSGNLLVAYVAENNENFLSVDIDYNPTTYKISGFALYDHLGFKYIFNNADSADFNLTGPGGNIVSHEKYMFQLSSIKDNNNASLLTLNYKSYGTNSINHVLESIVSNHGKVVFETTLGVSPNYFSTWKFSKVFVSDFRNNFVRRFDFIYYDDEYLVQLDESDLQQSDLLSHKFHYKKGLFLLGTTGTDEWGFQNINPAQCSNLTNVTPNFITEGVLQKISLPSGGSIIYEFESNTYSFKGFKPIDQISGNFGWEVDTTYYTNLKYSNLHNLQAQNLVSNSFNSGSSVNFSLSSTKEIIFKLTGEQYRSKLFDENGNQPMVYPTFTLRKNGIISQQLSINSFCENEGLGKKISLGAGNYTLTMNANAPTTGFAQVIAYSAVMDIKKWHYGNGIRIKRTGYFDTDAVNKNYYEIPNSTFFPIKEVSYDYNLADDASMSSGCIYNRDVIGSIPTIVYKNVTHTESGGNGKTVYTFYTPLDYYQLPNLGAQEPNFCKPKNIKIYNESGAMLQEKSFTYNSAVVGANNSNSQYLLNFNLSTSLPAVVRQKNYLPTLTETVWSFEYDSYRKLTNSREYVNPSGDILLNKYYYHFLNSATSKNRRVVEKIETFRNGELLLTNQVSFQNDWLGIVEPASRPGLTIFPVYKNVSYLPVRTETAKGEDNLVIGQRFTMYDGYSRLWESQIENGMKTVYIWGYKHTQIVAKIENMTFSTIPTSLIHDIVRASDTGTEAQLISAQNSLRNHALLAQAMITTYTYKPLIGVSTVTDVKNQTLHYVYDIHNKLKQVTDNDNNILRESEYYYQTQN